MFADNWALLYAQRTALKLEVPLHVCFCLVPKFLDATIRHYDFMLSGLQQVEKVSKSQNMCLKSTVCMKKPICQNLSCFFPFVLYFSLKSRETVFLFCEAKGGKLFY